MKITTWNCNGALRKKFGALEKLQSDIYLVQECENPVLTKNSKYQEWSNNHLWIGDNKNKRYWDFRKNRNRPCTTRLVKYLQRPHC